MFYCDKCALKYHYAITRSHSFGPCECCGKMRACNDRVAAVLLKDERLLPPTRTQAVARLGSGRALHGGHE